MHINTEELEKLSIADMFALADMIATKIEEETPTREEVYLAAVLDQEYKRRVAKLTAPTEPFDFNKWLIAKGWNGGYDNLRKQSTFEMEIDGELFRVLYGFSSVQFSMVRGQSYLIQDCLIPTTAQDAETLFRLFRLC